MAEKLTQKRLKEITHYNPDTGVFTWTDRITPTLRYLIGCPAGSDDGNGYIRIGIDKKDYRAQRLAVLYVKGYFPEHEVDHKDRDRSNNKWSNLRETTRICNSINSKVYSSNTTGVVGVYKKKNRWVAEIKVNKKKVTLGSHIKFIDAVKARLKAEVDNGFPNCNTTSSALKYIKAQEVGGKV